MEAVLGGSRTPPREAWLKATSGGAQESTSWPPWPTTGCHHQRPPSTRTAPQHTRDNGLAPPALTGAHTHCHTPKSRKPASQNTTSTHWWPPHPLRDATGQQRPGENTHMRQGQVSHPRQGKGSTGWSHTWDERLAAGRGRQAHTAGVTKAIQGPKTPRTRLGHQENQHGVPHMRAVP